MVASYVTQSSTTGHTGTTSVTPTLPTGTANTTDRVFVSVASAPPTSVVTTPAGWTKIIDVVLGGGTYGAGAGPRRLSVFYRDKDSSWSAIPVFSVPSGNVTRGVAWTVRKGAGEVWDTPTVCWGSQAPPLDTTTFTVTSEQPMTVKPGGLVFPSTVRPEGSTSSNPQASATGGITQISPVEIADGGHTTGNDIALTVGRATVGVGGQGYFTRSSTVSIASDSGGTGWVHQWAGTLETTAPTVPTGVSGAPSAGKVTLTWAASTDANGIAGYRVRRGGTLIATTVGNGTSYVDTTVAASTAYSYTVSALDTFGNESGQSAAAPVTTGAWTFPDLVIHSSSPPTAGTTAASITTAAFTPPAGALLVSCSTFDTTNVRNEVTTTVTGDTSAWTDHVDQSSGNGALGMESATALSSVSTTVQTAYPPATANPMNLSLEVFENAQVVQAGKVAATATQVFTIPRTSPNSRVIFTYAAANSTAAPTVPAGLEVLHLITTGYCGAAWITPALAAGDNVFTFTGVSAGAAMGWVEVAPGPVEPPAPAAATWVDSFDGAAPTKVGTASAVTIAGGNVTVNTDHALDQYSGVIAPGTYNLLGSHFGGARPTAPTQAAGDDSATALFQVRGTPGTVTNVLELQWRAGTLFLACKLNGTWQNTGVHTSYPIPAGTTHGRLRIGTDRAAVVEVLVSGAWQTLQTYTIPAGFPLGAVELLLIAGYWDNTDALPITDAVFSGVGDYTPPVTGQQLSRSLTSSAAITDTISRQLAAQRTLTDSAAITDSISYTLTPGAVPKAATFVEPFDDADFWPTWTRPYGSAGSAVDGKAVLPTAGTYHYLAHYSQAYDLTGSTYTIDVESAGAGVGTDITFGLSQLAGDSDPDRIRWTISTYGNGGSWWLEAWHRGVSLRADSLPAARRYLRWREAGGTLYWEHSTDGQTWTLWTSHTPTLTLTALYPFMYWGRWDLTATGVDTTHVVRGINEAITPPAPTWDLTDPRLKEIALQIVSTAENSTKSWWLNFDYIEDIGDGRGYTGGIVGWTTATYDMRVLINHYTTVKPGNVLAKWLDELAAIDALATQQQRNDASIATLGQPFLDDWATAATDSVFVQAQIDERDRVYWSPAYAQAVADGVGPLGLAIHYDISVNHGPGNDAESYGGILATARAAAPPPSQGGDETAYLNALIDAREDVLIGWGDWQATGRQLAHRTLLDSGNLGLVAPFSWPMYGTTFTISTWPDPWAYTPPIERTLTDSAAITDTISRQLAAQRTLTDDAAIVDSITARIDRVATLTDAAAITDSASTVLAAQRALTDSAAIADSITTQLAAQRSLTDAAAIVDSISTQLAASRALADDAAITDSATTQLAAQRALEDSAAITDSISWTLARVLSRALDDSAAIVDSISWRIDRQAQLTDSAAITDSASTALAAQRQLVDAAAIVDSITWAITRAKIALLVDTFETLDTGRWLVDAAAPAGSVTVTGGNLQLLANSAWSTNLYSQDRYDLVDSAISVEIVQHATSSAYVDTYFNLQLSPNQSVTFDVEDKADGTTRLGMYRNVGGTWTTVADLAHDPVAHRLLRFEHSGGAVLWQTSADGVTWTQRASWTPTFAVNDLMVTLGVGGDLNTGTALIGSVNVVEAREQTRTLTDSAAITDSISTRLDAQRALTDDAAITDSLSARLDRVAQLVDAAGITDSATTQLAASRALADSAAIVDSLSSVLVAARQLEDSAAITDAVTTALAAVRELSDSAAITDSISAVLDAQRTLVDDAAITDSATVRLDRQATLSDSAAITDSISWRIDRVVTLEDSAAVTDGGASTVLDAQRTLVDSAAITDSATVNVAGAGTRTLEDNAAITDSATTRLDAQRQLSDSAAITDSATVRLDRRAALEDSAAITDSISWRIDRVVTLTDSAAITDSATTAADFRRTLSDSAAITDSVTTEVTTGAVQEERELTDSAAITDAAVAFWDRRATLTDSAEITDSISWRIDRHVTLVDSAAITDEISADLKVGGAVLVDHAAITDSISWRIDRVRTLVDHAAITDSVTYRRDMHVVLVDSAGITDYASAVITVGRNIIVRWGPPQARQLSGEVQARQTSVSNVGYRTLSGTRVFRAGQISRGDYGGS